MASKYLCCRVLIVTLALSLSIGAEAQTTDRKIVSTGTIVGVLVGGIAIVVVVTYIAIHESTKKRSITGCVGSGPDGMTLTDEREKRPYSLTGNTAGLKPGDRMTLRGRRLKRSDPGKPTTWEIRTVSKDFGTCPSAP